MLDSFYTPKDLARRLVSYIMHRPRSVCDFCAGGGELIVACRDRFRKVRCVALDKSKIVVRRLRKGYPDWEVGELDVLNNRQLASLREANRRGFDIIVMNPPFSAKGKTTKIKIEGFVFKASPALQFVYRSTSFLPPSGHLLAILPSSTLYSERDADFIAYLKVMYKFKVLDHVQNVSFSGKSPNVALVDISPRAKKCHYCGPNKIKVPILKCLFRGACNVSRAEQIAVGNGSRKRHVGYVHSTNLKGGGVEDIDMYVPIENIKPIKGPAILLPRVGTPSVDKISVIKASERYGLSDCVIAVLFKTYNAALEARSLMLLRRKEYLKLYQGTAAKYVTMRRLSDFIDKVVKDKRYCRNAN